MKKNLAAISVAVATLAWMSPRLVNAAGAGSLIANWPEDSKAVATEMISKYGQPDAMGHGMLAWDNKGQFKRIVVHKVAESSHSNVLDETVNYRVASGAPAMLDFSDTCVIADMFRAEMTASGGSEAANIVALNLANDVLQGKKGAKEARDAYGEAADLRASGKASASKLLFKVDSKKDIDAYRDQVWEDARKGG